MAAVGGRLADPVRQLPQQHQARVRHDARASACDFKTARLSGSVYVERAPRTESDKGFDTPYRPRSGALSHLGRAAQPPHAVKARTNVGQPCACPAAR